MTENIAEMAPRNTGFRRKVRSLVGPFVLRRMRNIVARRSWAGAQDLGARLGGYGRYVSAHRHRLAIANLRVVFGDTKGDDEIQAIALESLRSVGRLAAESLRLPSMSREEIGATCVLEGEEHLWAALESGNGAVLPTPHLGNWEIVAVNCINQGLPVVALSRASRDERIARAITGVRKELSFPMIAVENGIRPCLRALNENSILAILPDRRSRGLGLTISFLGRQVCVWHTPILLAARAGAKVIISHCPRLADGRIRGFFDPPMALQTTDDREADLLANTQRMMTRLEEIIRQYPEQYMWQYDIFRDSLPLADTDRG
jgi:lauroyl/myristoyl acyltransferase